MSHNRYCGNVTYGFCVIATIYHDEYFSRTRVINRQRLKNICKINALRKMNLP